MTREDAARRIRDLLDRTKRPEFMTIDQQTLADRNALHMAISALSEQQKMHGEWDDVEINTDDDLISRHETADVIASMITYRKTLYDAYWYVKQDAPSSYHRGCAVHGSA